MGAVCSHSPLEAKRIRRVQPTTIQARRSGAQQVSMPRDNTKEPNGATATVRRTTSEEFIYLLSTGSWQEC